MTDDVIELNFDENKQFISALVKNDSTESDVTSKVTIEENSDSRLKVTLSLEKDYAIEVQFIRHLDLIRESHRIVLTFVEEELSSGTLFAKGTKSPIIISDSGDPLLKNMTIGKISNDGKTYTLTTMKGSILKSEVKNVLVTPCEVQS
jgi:hypothetical protein